MAVVVIHFGRDNDETIAGEVPAFPFLSPIRDFPSCPSLVAFSHGGRRATRAAAHVDGVVARADGTARVASSSAAPPRVRKEGKHRVEGSGATASGRGGAGGRWRTRSGRERGGEGERRRHRPRANVSTPLALAPPSTEMEEETSRAQLR
uniref:Uncharacterized protein n=1 Tax=Oryza rufipogon TaxID=4529 RepID=A0A0E0Q0E5_ORYRU